MDLPDINLKHFHYPLPSESIAQHPLKNRDESKLLVYSSGSISHQTFKDLGNFLPENTTLVFNDTKVIPARLFFQKPTGATIEILLLNPQTPSTDISQAMLARGSSVWTCMIGNLKRWKSGKLQKELTVGGVAVVLEVSLLSQDQVRFSWDQDVTFVEIIKNVGHTPLPPYMRREAEQEDLSRYQTVYSKSNGAIAAPTAGLHFTDSLLESIEYQGFKKEYLTLHVGAGTFLPIKTDKVSDHPMHGEQIQLTRINLEHLIQSDDLVAVGTTSLRTLESLYWYGVKLLNQLGDQFHIERLAPYHKYAEQPDFKESMQAVLDHMITNQLDTLSGYTEIFIFPPYRIKSCRGLITNFHLPGSTLILLVAAFIGDQWKQVYEEALENDYRFLSYGDSSLLLPGNTI